MIYKSNVTGPDLRPYFKLLHPPKQHCGYDAPSDPDFLPDCTFFTCDEASLLYNVAKSVPPGTWVDIGARLGWTAAHLAEAGHHVVAIDPELMQGHDISEPYPIPGSFYARFLENTARWQKGPRVLNTIFAYPYHSSSWFSAVDGSISSKVFSGFVIDGCHDSPEPLNDAKGALAHAKPDCIIVFHDFLGPAVRDGVRYLIEAGWRCKLYWTPNCMAVCWRGYKGAASGRYAGDYAEWLPPDHVPDPKMDFRPHKAAMVDFEDYWKRCE